MGRQTVDSYTSDSDSEVDVDFKVMDKIKKEVKKEGEEQRKESVYWGDNSDEEKELDPVFAVVKEWKRSSKG